jgi:hypothetical protein
MFLSYYFENGSPCDWEVDGDELRVSLLYDHEIGTINKAAGHFNFKINNPERKSVKLTIERAVNIWNGEKGSPFKPELPSYYSENGVDWHVFVWDENECGDLTTTFDPMSDFQVARLEPYAETELKRLFSKIEGHPLVDISSIGKTVEGRRIELIHIGSGAKRVLLRARAHPWEPGGNWVLEGLIEECLSLYEKNPKVLEDELSFDIIPITNKDGVARGMTRFNVLGADLNRGLSKSIELLKSTAPENAALLEWLDQSAIDGSLPFLAVDFHNDCCGDLHMSDNENPVYKKTMADLERLLRKETFFAERSITGSSPDTFGEALLSKYGINAAILELNARYLKGTESLPSARLWKKFGADFVRVVRASGVIYDQS